jgi:hypothetical protein
MRKRDIKVGQFYAWHPSLRSYPLLAVSLDEEFYLGRGRGDDTCLIRIPSYRRGNSYLGLVVQREGLEDADRWAEGGELPAWAVDGPAIVDRFVRWMREQSSQGDRISLQDAPIPAGMRLRMFTGRDLRGPWQETRAQELAKAWREASERVSAKVEADRRRERFAAVAERAARFGLAIQSAGDGTPDSHTHAVVSIEELAALLELDLLSDRDQSTGS